MIQTPPLYPGHAPTVEIYGARARYVCSCGKVGDWGGKAWRHTAEQRAWRCWRAHASIITVAERKRGYRSRRALRTQPTARVQHVIDLIHRRTSLLAKIATIDAEIERMWAWSESGDEVDAALDRWADDGGASC